MKTQNWFMRDRILELRSRWLTLISEHWLTSQGETLEYWRIEKADSLIVLPIQGHQILLPPPSYRPGIGKVTLDFPGGRVNNGQPLNQVAIKILEAELGISGDAIAHLTPLTEEGWAINSSFSNQKLYGYVAVIHENARVPSVLIGAKYPVTSAGITSLLDDLNCLQCRAVLQDWWMMRSQDSDDFYPTNL